MSASKPCKIITGQAIESSLQSYCSNIPLKKSIPIENVTTEHEFESTALSELGINEKRRPGKSNRVCRLFPTHDGFGVSPGFLSYRGR